MPNPNIPQGTLNRLKASMVLASAPELNVTPPFLGREMIHLAREGEATSFIPTSTGAVTSPEPYQKVTVTVHLLKTQALADAYKARMEINVLLGDITLYPDVQPGQGISTFQLSNCAIQNVNELAFDGQDAGYAVVIGGYYLINQNLFN